MPFFFFLITNSVCVHRLSLKEQRNSIFFFSFWSDMSQESCAELKNSYLRSFLPRGVEITVIECLKGRCFHV